MNCHIRLAKPEDAEDISRVVIAALRRSNAADYDDGTILRVEGSFSASAILELLTRRLVFVALNEGQVIATASLDPEYQGSGVGKQMMEVIESEAIAQGLERLRVPSSVTAEGFYAGLGFCKVRDVFCGEERTIVMQKRLIRA